MADKTNSEKRKIIPDKNKYREYSPIILRIGLSLVFLWFGLTNIFNGKVLINYLPSFAYSLPIGPLTILLINGIFEVFFGFLLIAGLFTRITSLILTLHLLMIVSFLGYNDIAVRDFGLALATLSIFFHGPDKWCLDKKRKNINKN